MSLTELEQHVFAYYVAGAAGDLTAAPRFYPHGELILIVEDKIQVATRKFGFKVKACAKAVATAFVDEMIAKGGWSTTTNDFGGTMHQFQGDAYRVALKELQVGNPIIQQANSAGPEFWDQAFASLTSS